MSCAILRHDSPLAPQVGIDSRSESATLTPSNRANTFRVIPMRSFKSLSEREILALAISLEEEDARIYADFAEGLRADFPNVADQFGQMRVEEDGHRHRLLELYRQKFGEHIPLIRRQDVKGFVSRRPVWLVRPLGLGVVRKQAETMEIETRRFYEKA